MSDTTAERSDDAPLDEIVLANRAIRQAKAVHKALGVPWATWGPNGVLWIPPKELPDLPLEDRGVLPTTLAPPPPPARAAEPECRHSSAERHAIRKMLIGRYIGCGVLESPTATKPSEA